MYALIRRDYWEGRMTRHEAVVSLWRYYGPPAVRNKARLVAEFRDYREISGFLDGPPRRPRLP
jgi:hypothetical protein